MIFLHHYLFKEGKIQDEVLQSLEKGIGLPERARIIGTGKASDGIRGFLIVEADKLDDSWALQWWEVLDMEITPLYAG